MITDRQMRWFELLAKGKIKKSQFPNKNSKYEIAARKHIEKMIENGKKLSRIKPEILQDLKSEYEDENLPRHRRAKALLEIVTNIENEPTVLSLIAEIYSEHSLEIRKKQRE